VAGFWGDYGPWRLGSRAGLKWIVYIFQWFVKMILGCLGFGFALSSAIAETLGKITE
jgi:hypothetical protein